MQSTLRQKLGENSMSQIFDTLKYTKRAVAAGLSQEAAEFHAEELATVVNDSLVTKEYLNTRLESTENKIDKKISELKFDLTWRILGGMVLISAMFKTVEHFFK
jgi:hypothetical protein